jgi:hypothetical protein
VGVTGRALMVEEGPTVVSLQEEGIHTYPPRSRGQAEQMMAAMATPEDIVVEAGEDTGEIHHQPRVLGGDNHLAAWGAYRVGPG